MIRKVLSVFPVVVVVLAIGCAQPSASPGLDEMNAFSVVYSHASVNSNMPDGTYESSGSPGTNGASDTYTVTTTVVPSVGDEIEMVYNNLVIDYGGKTYIVSGTITVTDFNAAPPVISLSFVANIHVTGGYSGSVGMIFTTTYNVITTEYSAVGTITVNGVPYSVSQFGVAP